MCEPGERMRLACWRARPPDECVVGIGGVGPASSVGESVELRLAYLSARLAKEDIVIGVRVKRWIEINEIDAPIGKLFPIREPF